MKRCIELVVLAFALFLFSIMPASAKVKMAECTIDSTKATFLIMSDGLVVSGAEETAMGRAKKDESATFYIKLPALDPAMGEVFIGWDKALVSMAGGKPEPVGSCMFSAGDIPKKPTVQNVSK